jgi:predicted DNA-binding transcriptional regulator AlpA
MTKRILSIDDLAELMNTTVFSIRSNLQRKNYRAVPRPMRLGRRLAWSAGMIEEFIRSREAEATEQSKGDDREPGRPRKSFDEQK